ncbi:hypothetical protein NPIL_7701 [Nephila pilipes]|uniref:BTB domain-containing protein n=1 Tax=Nephila pilipes TaxID=299642 RepID=A0A8X6TF94_NEPPI|nr:hypothetical protein NPIL_7701 [Nephila pilipes]
MANRRHVIERNFEFTWEIKEFLQHIGKNSFDLDTFPFSVKCVDITTWFLQLIPTKEHGDYRVSCILNRMHDELDSILLSLKIKVMDEFGFFYLDRNIPPITLTKEETEVSISNVIRSVNDMKSLRRTSSLFLFFKFKISVDPVNASSFNFNEGLQMLSKDLYKLFCNGDMKEVVMYAGDVEFYVHLSVMHARWPHFTEYLSRFPGLVRNPGSESISILDIEKLIIAAIQFHAYYLDEQRYFQKKIRETIAIFSPPLIKYLLFYIYTGKGKYVEENEKPDIIRICRLFNIARLIQKFQETPVASVCHTRSPKNHYIIDWSQEDGKNWQRIDFQPFVQLIQSHKENLLVLELQFVIQEDEDFIINLRYLETVNPITISCVILSRNNDRFVNETCHYSRYGLFHETWSVRVGMKKADVPLRAFRIDLILHYSYQSKIQKNVFSLNAQNTPFNQPLYRYAQDFWELYSNNRMSDVVLIADGTLIHSHKYILSARSPQLQNELLSKLHKDYPFIHLLHGLSQHVLDGLMRFIYTGEMDSEDIENDEFRVALEKYELRYRNLLI